jgi:long-chain-fatty-acid--CoA ligase ACSBG
VQPEWHISNCGAILASCIAAGIYTTNLPAACHYITGHSQAGVVVVDDKHQLAKYCSVPKSALPHLKAIVVFLEPSPLDEELLKTCNFPVYLWDDFLKLGSTISDSELELRQSSIRPGNCSTLIYTSGTTGPPKAVMVSHDNVTWTARNIAENFIPGMNHTERMVSYLPLSHMAAQLVDIHIPMYLGSSVYFCQPDAMKGSLTVTMRQVRPTLFLTVPRVWEKIQEKLVQIGRETTAAGGLKPYIVAWAKLVAAERSRMHQFGTNEEGDPWGYSLASYLVLNTVKEALGLDCAKGCFTSAAPISMDTLNFFANLDIPIYEIFGQSECTGPHTVCSPGQWRIGTCGRPMPGTESKIGPINGELCYRGRHIFMGYMYMPKETAESIDEDGWLHSGDVAEFDSDNHPLVPAPSGFMKITGRIKELIITAGGENVPPVLIENDMKATMNAISNCVVIGDRRKYLSMLVTLKTEMDKETGAPTDVLAADALFVAKNIGSSATTVAEAAADPLWKKYFDDGMKAANR